MDQQLVKVADGFWNIRGSFRIAGVIDIGTQMSLVRRGNGKFVLLDACATSDPLARRISRLTRGGKEIEAILNLHPFHTVHVRSLHERYPHAKLYGTARHAARFPDLPWQKIHTEDRQLHALFARDLEFSVPRGVDFISANENVHFSSVLALHGASQTMHVDDTLMYIRLPLPMRMLGLRDSLRFHPTLSRALEKRAGAAQEFRQWAEDLAERWGAAQNLCAAHTAVLTAAENRGAPLHERLLAALGKTSATLNAHRRRYG